jgi:hypothetical protein
MSVGDTVFTDENTPGGQSFQGHSADITSINKIKAGNWDYVVLQEQSLIPSYPDATVQTMFFPFARKLDSLIKIYSPCGKTMFYMTWGRKNGYGSYTYMAMDSMIRLRYMQAADSNNAELSAVGAVWRYIRAQYPTIELYQSDESHPSAEGAYAAACAFYAAIFRKDPETITANYTLSSTVANNIKTAAKKVIYDSLSYWHIGEYDFDAGFSYTQNGKQFNFTNTSTNTTSYNWNFGDGKTATVPNPTHTYADSGIYTVTLVAKSKFTSCTDSFKTIINLLPAGVYKQNAEDAFSIYPNPVNDELNITSADFLTTSFKMNILNSAGSLISTSRSAQNKTMKIDMSGYSSGLYFLQVVKDDGSKQHYRFIKQ